MQSLHKCCAVALLSLLAVAPAGADELRVLISNLPVAVQRDAAGVARFTGADIHFPSRTGEPAIPYTTVRVLLPPTTQMASVTAHLEQARMETVAGIWNVLPTPPAATWRFGRSEAVWPEGKAFVNGREVQVYSTNAPFPATLMTSILGGQLRDWKLVDVTLPVAQFNPVTGALQRLASGSLVVRFTTVAPRQQFSGEYGDAASAGQAKKLASNFDQIAPEYRTSRIFVSHKPVYLIVTTRQIERDSAALKRFTQSKKKRGFDVNVATEDKWGGGLGDRSCRETAGVAARRISLIEAGAGSPQSILERCSQIFASDRQSGSDCG